MSQNCDHNCSSCKADCGEREIQKLPLHHMSKVKKVIAVMSGKGGVGKSSITSLLATSVNKMGYKTAILDADITGPSIPKVFGISEKAKGSEEMIFPEKTRTGIDVISINLMLENDRDPVVWRGPVIAGVVHQFWQNVLWEDVDYMFVDMPPGTGDVPLTVFQSLPVDGIIVVTSPQELVSMIVEKAVKMANMMNIPILGMVENYSYFLCPDNNKKYEIFGESHIEEIAQQYQIPVIAKLPIDPAFAKASDNGNIESCDTSAFDSILDYIK